MQDKEKWQCPLPHTHLEIQPAGDVFVCCHSLEPIKLGNLHSESLKDIWESSKRIAYEEAFDSNNGEKLPHCYSCKKLENEGGVSGRQREILRWKGEGKNVSLTGPKSIAIRYSNLCNLKCRSCKPSTSTAWFSDAKKINPNIKLKKLVAAPISSPISDQLVWLLRNGLQKIYFAGGEALLEKDHYLTLEKIIAINPEVEITYDTNFSILGTGQYDVLEFWKKLNNITVSASIDGSKEKCEYLRSGLTWETYCRNLERIKSSAPNVNTKIHYTVSLYNIFHFPDFIRESHELGLIMNSANLDIGLCEDPIWLNIRALPQSIKDMVISNYKEFLKSDLGKTYKTSFEEILLYLKTDYDIKYFIAFAGFTKKLDTIREESFSDTFPKASKAYNKYINV
jgi:radical SAM protein with 4Fe4S-binding SPASM domain